MHTIVGVAPAGLLSPSAPAAPQVYYPIDDEDRLVRGSRSLDVIARMRDGASMEDVRAQAAVAAQRLFDVEPGLHRTESGEARPIQATPGRALRIPPGEEMTVIGGVGGALAVTAVILLVAATNLANMVLTRGLKRRGEIGIRQALGASRRRLVAQLATESLLLSTTAGALALFGVYVFTSWLASGPVFAAVPAGIDVGVDWRVVVFTLGVSTLAGLAVGLLPAMHVTRTPPHTALRQGSALGPRRRVGLRGLLVTAQLAGSLVLVVAALLFVRSFEAAHRVDLGFEPAQVAVLDLNLDDRRFTPEAAVPFFDRVGARLATLPGVERAGFARVVPLSGSRVRDVGFDIEDYAPPQGDPTMAGVNYVSSGYFALMRIGLAAGREFTAEDRQGAPPVALVNQAFVDRYWPGRNPLGLRVAGCAVVGVVQPLRHESLSGPEPPVIWKPVAQVAMTHLVAHVRASGDLEPVLRAMEQVVADEDPLAIARAVPMSAEIADALFLPRVLSLVFGVAGALALALASLGVYGVMSYVVGLRAREMGIRLALGATPGGLVALVMREGASLSAVGFGLGAALSVGVAFVLQSMLVGIAPLDPIALGAGAGILIAAAAAACYLPARRAARIDPVASLRAE
jgi:predicted permease